MTPMRDLGHLEQLSSTVALGMWADDVVIALDRAQEHQAVQPSDAETLRIASEVLKSAARRAEHPMEPPRSAHNLAATDNALTFAASFVDETSGKNLHFVLESMADVLVAAAAGQLPSQDSTVVSHVIQLFSSLGEHQLLASKSVLTSRKDALPWTETPMTSRSS
jgi:hypothetical protein